MAGGKPASPVFNPDGSTDVPAFRLPASSLLSDEAAAFQRRRASMPMFDGAGEQPEIAVRRAQVNDYARGRIAELRAMFPVDIAPATYGGIEVLDITPAGGGHDPDRVLINLHGGAFTGGWDGVAQMEAIPIASMAQTRVITVNYRLAPEFHHPAGVEDVAAVYTALLDTYAPGRIGIFGGSAGGALAAQTVAWLPAHGLPQAAAVGIFGAGGAPFGIGESAYLSGYTDGLFPAPPPDGSGPIDITRGYFDGINPRDPTAWPAYDLAVMATFPPTLIITGTRAMDLSPAIFTNSQLLKAGIRSTLIVGEGMGHCFHYAVTLPEGRDACDAIIAFFRDNLD